MVHKSSYSIPDLVEAVEEKRITLPTVQRGFVWRPSQIENLWDSLLRGYPIGAFVFAPTDSSTLELLDGQQRLTAICLGLGAQTFRDSDRELRIFVDLWPSGYVDDSRRYIIRVITRSHPWGYRRRDNTKTLEQSAIRQAIERFGVTDPIKLGALDRFFPQDAHLPVPLADLFKADSPEGAWEAVEASPAWPTATNIDETRARALAETIWEQGQKILSDENRCVPALYLDWNRLVEPEPPLEFRGLDASEPDEHENPDDIETLFVRLNDGGSPLAGEDLNYSILKARITANTLDSIETHCQPFYRPARFITIAYRLYRTLKPSRPADRAGSVSLRLKPRQFQRELGKDTAGFEDFIHELFANKYDGVDLLAYLKRVLVYRADTLPFGLPYVTAMELSEQAPEILFLLCYRVRRGDRFSPTTNEKLHRRMLGVMSLLLWFRRRSGASELRRVLNNLWPAAVSLKEPERFWSQTAIDRAMIDDGVPPITPLSNVQPLLAELKKRKKNQREAGWKKKLGALLDDPFLGPALRNRSLLLYGQRQFLAEYLPEEQFHLQDTAVPFDWDHISPQNRIKGRWHIPSYLHDCYNLIGNLRAWPYAFNRMDGDLAPAVKLNPFRTDDERASPIVKSRWTSWLEEHAPGLDSSRLSRELLTWSRCSKAWLKCDPDDLRDKTQAQALCELIMDRGVGLYAEWYRELRLDDLLCDASPKLLDRGLNHQTWSDLADWENKQDWQVAVFLDQDTKQWWFKGIPACGDGLYLYFGYPDPKKTPQQLLKADAIEFGLADMEEAGTLKNVVIPAEFESRYSAESGTFLWQTFTLVSTDDASYCALLQELYGWLAQLPAQKRASIEGSKLANAFKQSLKGQYRNAL